MNKSLRSLLVVFFLAAFTGISAQVKPGYIFGLNLSTMTIKSNGLSINTKLPASVHFGGFFKIPVTDNFSFQPAILFSAKGTDYKIDTAKYSISPIYIEVPVIAVYSFGSDLVKISLFAGPYFAYGVGGYKIISGGELLKINYGSGENNDLKPFDIGLNFGAGISIKGLMISAQYGIGLANISPVTTDDSIMKNKVVGISISSLFANK